MNGSDSYVISLLVAGGHVTPEKVAEARSIAATTQPPHSSGQDQDARDAARYRTMLANLHTIVLVTEKGSTLDLRAPQRGEQHSRKGTDAVLDGLAQPKEIKDLIGESLRNK